MKKSSSLKKTTKKVFNTLWIVGTCLGLLLILIAIIVSFYNSYKEDKKASVLTNISRYNANKFGYIAGEVETLKYRDITPVIPENLNEVLMSIDATAIEVRKPYNVVAVFIKEPVDDIATVENTIRDYVDFWEIVKEGISYYGTPNDTTVSEEDIEFVGYTSEDIDTFRNNLEIEIKSNTNLHLFIDYNYVKVPLFDKLCTELSNVIDNAEEADKIIVELKVISEIGTHTSNLDYLYELVEKIK